MTEHAAYHHAANLDGLQIIGRFINEHNDADRNKYLNCLSEGMVYFVEQEKSDMNREDLYDVYAALFEEYHLVATGLRYL